MASARHIFLSTAGSRLLDVARRANRELARVEDLRLQRKRLLARREARINKEADPVPLARYAGIQAWVRARAQARTTVREYQGSPRTLYRHLRSLARATGGAAVSGEDLARARDLAHASRRAAQARRSGRIPTGELTRPSAMDSLLSWSHCLRVGEAEQARADKDSLAAAASLRGEEQADSHRFTLRAPGTPVDVRGRPLPLRGGGPWQGPLEGEWQGESEYEHARAGQRALGRSRRSGRDPAMLPARTLPDGTVECLDPGPVFSLRIGNRRIDIRDPDADGRAWARADRTVQALPARWIQGVTLPANIGPGSVLEARASAPAVERRTPESVLLEGGRVQRQDKARARTLAKDDQRRARARRSRSRPGRRERGQTV